MEIIAVSEEWFREQIEEIIKKNPESKLTLEERDRIVKLMKEWMVEYKNIKII